MMSDGLISIIIPVYNIEEQIEKCLQSIVSQTYSNIEIIVVDDGSTDSSGKIIDKFAESDNRIIVIHKENGGVGSAKNTGLKYVHGEYIGFVDGDDYINCAMYEILIRNLEKYHCDIAGCCFKGVSDDNPGTYSEAIKSDSQKIKILNNFDSFYKYYFEFSKENERTFFTTSVLSLCNKVFRKELLEGISFPENTHMGEDSFVYFDILKKAQKSVYTDLKLYYYYNRVDSATRTKYESYEKINARLLNKVKTIGKYINILDDLGYYDLSNSCLNIELFDIIMECSKKGTTMKLRSLYKRIVKKILNIKGFGHSFTLKRKILIILFLFSPMLYKKMISKIF